MARWQPNPRDRLARAAIELFAERGYDQTTVADIAERAGLTKSTFFRHFADKREVLFGGQDELLDTFRDAIRAAPPSATPIECVAAVLDAVAPAFDADRHELAADRIAVIDGNTELRERELLKRARMVAAIDDALRKRKTDPVTAHLAAEIGVLAFGTAYRRWAARRNRRPFAALAADALQELCDHAAALARR